MSKGRMTFVGIGPCGHAGFLAQDPATYPKRLSISEDEYKSLVEDLRYYAQHGQIRLVDDSALGEYVEQMKDCRCTP